MNNLYDELKKLHDDMKTNPNKKPNSNHSKLIQLCCDINKLLDTNNHNNEYEIITMKHAKKIFTPQAFTEFKQNYIGCSREINNLDHHQIVDKNLEFKKSSLSYKYSGDNEGDGYISWTFWLDSPEPNIVIEENCECEMEEYEKFNEKFQKINKFQHITLIDAFKILDIYYSGTSFDEKTQNQTKKIK